MASFLSSAAVALIAALAAYFGARAAFKREVDQAAKDRRARVDAEAATDVVDDIIRLAAMWRDVMYARATEKWAQEAYEQRSTLHAAIKRKIMGLPSPAKERVSQAVEVINDAEELHHFHYSGPLALIAVAEGDAILCLRAVETGRELPRRPMTMIELEYSQRELGEMRFEGHEHEEQEYLQAQQAWWSKRPETVAALRQAGFEIDG